MKREKEVPADLLAYLESQKQQAADHMFSTLDMFCTVPVKAVRMKMLRSDSGHEAFRTAVIPPVDVYTTDKPMLKEGFLKRDALCFFVAGTNKAFPYGHVYVASGHICLGNIFVPSAVPEMSVMTPLETLFLHNDRNLSHGNSHLSITGEQAKAIDRIISDNRIPVSRLSRVVMESPGRDIIANDEIWSLSADVAAHMPLLDALHVMADIYAVIFKNSALAEQEG